MVGFSWFSILLWYIRETPSDFHKNKLQPHDWIIFEYFSLKTWLKVGISLTFLTLDFWIGFQPDLFRLTCSKEPPHFCTISSLPKIFQPPPPLCTFRELFILRDPDEVVPFLCSRSTVFSVFFFLSYYSS